MDSAIPASAGSQLARTQPVPWLWPGRIATGRLTLIDGDPEQGKSLVTLDLAARLTSGQELPDGFRPAEPVGVLLLPGGEDNLADTIVPRLRPAGADLHRIHVLQNATGEPRVFPEACSQLKEMIEHTRRGSNIMTAAARRRRAHQTTQVARRRIVRIATSIGVVLLVAGLAAKFRFKTSPPEVAVPEPPSIDRVADPAVKKLLSGYRTAVVQSPLSGAAWGRLGMALFAHDFTEEATVSFTVAGQLDPREARWAYFQGAIRAETDPDGAFQELERAANLCADEPDAPRLQLAELLLAHGYLDRAAEQFQCILRRDPTNARAHLGLGRLAFSRGGLLQAQTHLGFCVSDRHTQKGSYLLFAQIHERLGKKADAEREYREAASVQNEPAWPDPYFAEARKLQTGMKIFLVHVNLLLEQGRLDACVAECRKLVHDYPDSDMMWLTLGKALVRKRDMPAAHEVLRKVLALAPDSVQVYFELGFASYLRHDYRAAATWYRKATELKPDFTFAYHDLGHCLNLLGDRAGAIEAFRAALRCQPDLAEVHRILGELLTKEGERAAAFDHLRLALQLKPTDAKVRLLFGQALNRLMVSVVP